LEKFAGKIGGAGEGENQLARVDELQIRPGDAIELEPGLL
jgi:hypothetical protein